MAEPVVRDERLDEPLGIYGKPLPDKDLPLPGIRTAKDVVVDESKWRWYGPGEGYYILICRNCNETYKRNLSYTPTCHRCPASS